MEPEGITLLLQGLEKGDAKAADRILPLVYEELRKLAAAKMARESMAQTLQPTALVHEAWLRLGGDQQTEWKDRAHFFAAAAESMRRILIENARHRAAVRHGGGLEKVSASTHGFEVAAPDMSEPELLLLNEALDNFAVHDERRASLVKQWYFVGLKIDEIALSMGISERTAMRDWAYARAWLLEEMERLRG